MDWNKAIVKTLSCALYLFLCNAASGQSPTQSSAKPSTVDPWGDHFFDTSDSPGPMEGPAADEFPTPIQIALPDRMSDVKPFADGTVSPELNGWVRWMVLRNIPSAYEDNKKWNQQKEVLRSLDWQRDGWQLKPVPIYKKVNQGTWTRYYIELIDPANRLLVHIENLQQPREGIIAFDIVVETPLKAFGRMSRWQRDVQLVSLSVNAEALAKMSAHCEVEVLINPLKIPPDVRFRPKVTQAHVELLSFRATRISQIGGPLAKHLGTTLREILEDQLADYDDKLVEKINKQLDRQQDRLSLSLQDWMQTQVQSWVSGKR